MAEDQLIAAYLVELDGLLQGFWPRRRRILAELEEHLTEATEKGRSAGLDGDEAQRQAIARLGPTRVLARRFAEERLAAKVPGVIPLFGLAVAAMVVIRLIEPLFAVPAVFHLPAPQPALDRMLLIGDLFGVLTLLLLPFILLVHKRPPVVAEAVAVLVTSLSFVSLGTGLGGWMLLHAQQGAASPVPLTLRVATVLVICGFAVPMIIASDARKETLKAAR